MTNLLPHIPQQALIATGELLAIARKERGWRQIDAAQRLNVSRQIIARIEKGDSKVAVGTYFAYAWLLRVPIIPGLDLEDRETKNTLSDVIKLLKQRQPKHIREKRRKIIDDNF